MMVVAWQACLALDEGKLRRLVSPTTWKRLMFGRLKRLIGKGVRQDIHAYDDMIKAAQSAVADLDWNDPAVRTDASLYLILSKQFDLIGKREGGFPFIAPYASDKARGALIGTVYSIVHREYGELHQEGAINGLTTAFGLDYGQENSRIYVLQALKDSTEGNEEINFARDWAIADTNVVSEVDSPATPSAFYLAVAGMI